MVKNSTTVLTEKRGAWDMGKFKKGQSGNPAGRPPGSRNKTTIASQNLLDGEAEAITRKAIRMAKNGDTLALRLCLDRIYPKPKESRIKAPLPTIATAADIPMAIVAIFKMIGGGEITVEQGKALANIVATQCGVLETTELEKRIASIEETLKSKDTPKLKAVVGQ